ncbi:MAG: hypothetical protein C4525_00375 [Desulfarculus sp.]|nr:MAG: hypothetical protein C4525_00375 [Desulfarculus sp.]
MTPGEEAVAQLLPQVRANCSLADAAVAGRFSLCGLLLRLRNLYKWEQGLAPWQEPDTPRVLEWVSRREELWEGLLEAQPQPLTLAGQAFDPFDAEGLNQVLAPLGLLYGAGRVGGLLPVFFLGRLETACQQDGMRIFHLGPELTKDILFLPGLRQGGCIYLRSAPFPYLLWDLLSDPRPSLVRCKRFGLAGYGLDYTELLRAPSWEVLRPVLRGEMEAVLWHELGEAGDGAAAAELLRRAAAGHPGSELEHFVRGVKDLLADCGPQGRLSRIIAEQRQGALGLYPVWLAGFLRLLFPEITRAVEDFAESRDWGRVEQARLLGWRRAQAARAELTDILATHQGAAARTLARRVVIEPLVGSRSAAQED